MPDNQTDIKIGVQYDGSAVQRAIVDMEQLPEAAKDLGADINNSTTSLYAMSDALRRASEALQSHVASLDPASAGYAAAAAQAANFIARQTTLSTRAETVLAAFVSQADALQKLAEQYSSGAISQNAFAEGCETISQSVIRAEQSLEKLQAQMNVLSSRQQAQALKNLEPPPVPARAMASWSGFFSNLKQGFASGTLSVNRFLSSAAGIARISAWGAVAKTAMDGISNAGSKIREQMGCSKTRASPWATSSRASSPWPPMASAASSLA